MNSANRTAPPPKPLYIEPDADTRLRLDHNALRIERPGRAPQTLPLRRISRVYLGHHVHIATPLIRACAERGIIIVLQDEHGQIDARIIGRTGAHTRLRQRLYDLTDRPDWRIRYSDWKRAMRRRIGNTLRHRLGAPRELRNRPEKLQQWIDRQLARTVGARTAETTRRHIRRAAVGWMQQRLFQEGVGAENEQWLTGSADLAQDLGGLLAYRMETLRYGWLQGRARVARERNERPRPPAPRLIVRKIENHRGRTARLGNDLINRLHRWLIELE